MRLASNVVARSSRPVLGLLIAAFLAGCVGAGASVSPSPGAPAGSSSQAAPGGTNAVPTASPALLPGELPSPDGIYPAEDCPATTVCHRVATNRLSGIPLTTAVPCRADGTTCILVIDIYYPINPPKDGGTYPIAVYAKGGPDVPETSGFSSLVTLLAGQGVVVFDTSWRQGPAWGAPTWAEGLQDVACAVRAARFLGPKVGGSARRITMIGHSLGGWAAAVTVLAPAQVQPEPQCLFSAGAQSADAFAGLAGVYGDPADLIATGGVPNVPVLLICGDADTRLGESQGLAKALTDAGRKTSVLTEPGVDHNGVLSTPATIRALVDLLNKI